MGHIRKLNKEENDAWSRAIHRACKPDMLPALRAAYSHIMPFIDETASTEYTDCCYRVGMPPSFLDDNQTPLELRCMILIHETMHNTQNHLSRTKKLNGSQMRKNIVTDLEINSLIASGIAKMDLKNPESKTGNVDWMGGCLMPGRGDFIKCPPNLTAEAYATYVVSAEKEQSATANPNTDDDSSPDNGDTSNQHNKVEVKFGDGTSKTINIGLDGVLTDQEAPADVWSECDKLGIHPISAAEEEKVRNNVRHDIDEMLRQTSRSYGTSAMNELLARMQTAMRPPSADWRTLLAHKTARYVGEIKRGRDDYKLGRPSRRMINQGIIAPSFISYVPKIRLAVDTSGSMGTAEYTEMLTEAEGILKNAGGKIEVVCIDTETHGKPKKMSSTRDIGNNLRGGGGTDMSAACHQIDKERPCNRPDILVIATDGYWDWDVFAESLNLKSMRRVFVIVLICAKELDISNKKKIVGNKAELVKVRRREL